MINEIIKLDSNNISKTQIDGLVQHIINTMLDDGTEPANLAQAIAVLEQCCKQFRAEARFNDYLRDSIIKHNGKITLPSGTIIEATEAGVSYDYSSDGTWRQLNEEIEALTEKRKALEAKLRKLRPGVTGLIDPETGEGGVGPLKTSKSTYRITLKK